MAIKYMEPAGYLPVPVPDAAQQERARRWLVKTKARVSHPGYGSVIVPHASNYAAIKNAAEFWQCDYEGIMGECSVQAAKPGEGPVRRPKEFYKKVK